MRRTIILALMISAAFFAFGQADASTATVPETTAAASEVVAPVATAEPDATVEPEAAAEPEATAEPEAATTEPEATVEPEAALTEPEATAEPEAVAEPEAATAPEEAAAAAAESAVPATDQESETLAEIAKLSAELEEANAVIDELRTESYDLKNAVDTAENKAKAAMAIAEASDAQRLAAEHAAEQADALAADATKLKAKVAELEAKIAKLESGRDELYGKLASFGNLRLDPETFTELMRKGFDGYKVRLGTWKLTNGVLSQTNAKQYFSRLTFPLVQSSTPVLYSFETKASAKGWVGTGIHLFADGVKKGKGFGEGKSLLVWLTRDSKVRGNDGTYLQVYRSDSDVSMERVLDAKIKERLDGWNRVDVLYEPGNEFIVIAVNGTVRAAYRTYFGIGAGATISLRTLGDGVQFRNLEVRR
jgi:chemotaxis protein histidine kinase CheA